MDDELFSIYQEIRDKIEYLISKGSSKDEIIQLLEEDIE